MGKYKLKAGSFLVGSGQGRKKYNHADPTANVVESDVNLAAKHPEKFDRIEDYSDGPYQFNPQANRRGATTADPAELQAKSGQMPSLTATTAHRVDKKGKTLDDQYGNLDDMDLSDLRQLAEAEEIALPKGLTKKEDVVKHLRASKGETHAPTTAPAATTHAAHKETAKETKSGK